MMSILRPSVGNGILVAGYESDHAIASQQMGEDHNNNQQEYHHAPEQHPDNARLPSVPSSPPVQPLPPLRYWTSPPVVTVTNSYRTNGGSSINNGSEDDEDNLNIINNNITTSEESPGCSISCDIDKYLAYCRSIESQPPPPSSAPLRGGDGWSRLLPARNQSGSRSSTGSNDDKSRKIRTLLLNRLPAHIYESHILPYAPILCQDCFRVVSFSDFRRHDPSPSSAVYLEETIRFCTILKRVNTHWIYGYQSRGYLVYRTFLPNMNVFHQMEIPLPSQITTQFVSQRIRPGTVWREPEEEQLLGPFRFCLVQRPIVSLLHYITLNDGDDDDDDKHEHSIASSATHRTIATTSRNNDSTKQITAVYCSHCATKKQKQHCLTEFDRIRQARLAAHEAWILQHGPEDKGKQK